MMADDIVRLHGLEGVRKALRALPDDLRKKELNKALRPGARLIQNTAKALAPRGTGFFGNIRGKPWAHYAGTLINSIAIRREKKRYLKDDAKLRIGVLSSKDPNNGAFYWRFVEFGTSKMPAANGGIGFLVPAFESTKYAANKLIIKALLKGVEKSANRVRSR